MQQLTHFAGVLLVANNLQHTSMSLSHVSVFRNAFEKGFKIFTVEQSKLMTNVPKMLCMPI